MISEAKFFNNYLYVYDFSMSLWRQTYVKLLYLCSWHYCLCFENKQIYAALITATLLRLYVKLLRQLLAIGWEETEKAVMIVPKEVVLVLLLKEVYILICISRNSIYNTLIIMIIMMISIINYLAAIII